MQPKALVLRAAGTNCDRESQYALELAGFAAKTMHVFRLMEQPALLDNCQLLMIPTATTWRPARSWPTR